MNPGKSAFLEFGHELIIDLFAGGGGASLGIEQAFGRSPDIAINHSADAIAMHAANHPETSHLQCDVFEVDPLTATAGRPVGLLWASPDCKHFSKAKGGKPRSKKIRSLAWVVVKWAEKVRPRVIMLENVEEFVTWGPLGPDQKPCPRRKGQTFKRWVAQLRARGYKVEWRELRACDYGAPTIRKRFFLVARCDGQAIRWPDPTHGMPDNIEVRKGKRLPWRTAAECIDFDLPCPSIFLTKEEGRGIGVKRPLAEATMRRIAKGVVRFVLDATKPFIVNTQSGAGESTHGEVVSPVLTEHANASRAASWTPVEPLRTQCAEVKGGHFAIIAAHLDQANVGFYKGAGRSVDTPVGTVCAQGSMQRLVATGLVKLRGDNVGTPADAPLHAVSVQGMRHAEVRAFLIAYYGNEKDGRGLQHPMGTVVSRERFGLVTVDGADYAIADIGLRMLTPRELFRAQGFPDSYVIDVGANGKRLPKDAQVRACGNSVCPPMARALVAANLSDLIWFYARAAA